MRHLSLLAVLLMSACLYAEFGDLESNASVRGYSPPDYPMARGFGLNLETLGDGRVVASAGPSSPHAVFRVVTDEGPGSGAVLFDGCEDDCDSGAGADFASLGDLPDGRSGCFAFTSLRVDDDGSDGIVRIQCVSSPGNTEVFDPGFKRIGLGASIAAARIGGQLALVSAPEEGPGALFGVPAEGIAFTRIQLPEGLALSEGGGFGANLDTFPRADGSLVVAGAASDRIAVFSIDSALNTSAIGCLPPARIRRASAFASEGGALRLADLQGDGEPELIVGDADNARVTIASLAELGSCEAPSAPAGAQTIQCGDLPTENGAIVCAGLGSAISSGDFDGDGDTDLALGAALSTVEGAAGAGVAYVLFQDGGFAPANAGVARFSSAGESEELGTRLSAVPFGGRSVLVAGAPGRNAFFAFFCPNGFGGPGTCALQDE